jgi:dTDP-4-dehydrorhamnose reductase
MKDPLHTAIIGTGFLGRVLVHKLNRLARPVVHTFNTHQVFNDSVQLDLFHQDIATAMPVTGLDVVIIAALFEDHSDTEAVLDALRRNIEYLKDKRVIYISSDAVFDGRKGMYSEEDSPSPLTSYGKNKLLCEETIRTSLPDHCIVRTSYIYGHSLGSLDPRLAKARQHVQAGQAFERFDDMYKSPIEVRQLADAIVALSKMSFRGVIHVAGERMSVFEFYRRALQSLGDDCRSIRPVRIPSDAPVSCLADTSLDVSLAKRLLGIDAGTIESSLRDMPAKRPSLQLEAQ